MTSNDLKLEVKLLAIRYQMPYNGKRFMLNIRTNELHDLENEQSCCRINSIRLENLIMFDELTEGFQYQRKVFGLLNGCYWCQNQFNKG